MLENWLPTVTQQPIFPSTKWSERLASASMLSTRNRIEADAFRLLKPML
jgi:hypothetical protein